MVELGASGGCRRGSGRGLIGYLPRRADRTAEKFQLQSHPSLPYAISTGPYTSLPKRLRKGFGGGFFTRLHPKISSVRQVVLQIPQLDSARQSSLPQPVLDARGELRLERCIEWQLTQAVPPLLVPPLPPLLPPSPLPTPLLPALTSLTVPFLRPLPSTPRLLPYLGSSGAGRSISSLARPRSAGCGSL
jgi:hypothetical protein